MTVRRIERIWSDDVRWARQARMLLSAPGIVYGAATALRNTLYDHRIFTVHEPAVPTISLGNLSVGGTGKTPVAAWAARRLVSFGARPAIVLRGYGDDESLVHARLNPEVPVVADADRVRGVRTAAMRGADCVVLDDAFQHRRIARVADWVLVAAEQWRDDARLLPAGPLRESPRALGRATVVIVTRKTASLQASVGLAERLGARVGGGAWAVIHLAPEAVVSADGVHSSLTSLAGRRVLAVAAVGVPASFFGQLAEFGARAEPVAFPDHHRFTAQDAAALARRAAHMDGVICTLKDAVKLAPLWRGAAVPLWYVSQSVVVDRGEPLLDASLEAVLAARAHS